MTSPPWKTVHHYFRRWLKEGVLEKLHVALRHRVRLQAGAHTTLSAAIIDSQSVNTPEVVGRERGFDAGTPVKGRKRHLLVDTPGLIWRGVVQAASVPGRAGGEAGVRKSTRETVPAAVDRGGWGVWWGGVHLTGGSWSAPLGG